MTLKHCAPPALIQLSQANVADMGRSSREIRGALSKAGLSDAAISAALQVDIDDAHERKSAACPYEQHRAVEIVRTQIQAIDADWHMITAGDPRHRIPIGKLQSYRTAALLRRFRAGCERLEAEGYAPRGFAVVEIHLCCPLSRSSFWEPHLHALLCGAPPRAVRAAFRVRPSTASTFRNRLLRLDEVTDLHRAVGYLLKIKPRATVEYRGGDGRNRWKDNDLRDQRLADWAHWMSRRRVSELVVSRRINLSALPRPRCFELASPPRTSGRLVP